MLILDSQHQTDRMVTGAHTPRRPDPEDLEIVFDENTLRTNGQNAEDDWVEAGWDGPAKPGVWSDWIGRKIDKGDKWYVSLSTSEANLMLRWDPVHGPKDGSEIPSNFTPGVMPVLGQILNRSISKGLTRSAVLSKDAVHIKSALSFDIGKWYSHSSRSSTDGRLGMRIQKCSYGYNSPHTIQARLPTTIL
jgi:hypothetical protein